MEIGSTEQPADIQPADIQPPAGRLSGTFGLALALGAVLVAGIVTALILRRRRG